MNPLRKFTCLLLMISMTSSVHAARTHVNEADIDATPAEVWNAWTTEEGFTSWAVAKAKFDLRVGGEIVTSYVADSTLDDDSTIVNRILSFEPERMLSIQNIRAPKAFKNAELFQDSWTVLYLEPLGDERTHVRIVGMGYGEGPEWDEIYNKFEVGNEYTLKKLQEKFSSSAAGSAAGDIDPHNIVASDAGQYISDAKPVMELLGRLVGGEWIHDGHTPDGNVFLVRNVLEHGPDGVSMIASGWLGDAAGMAPHQSTQIFRVAGAAANDQPRVRFHGIDEHSSVSQGDIVLVDPQTVHWNWNLTALDGQTTTFRVRMKFADDDHYQFTLSMRGEDGQWNQMVDAGFERVKDVPEKFRKLRETH